MTATAHLLAPLAALLALGGCSSAEAEQAAAADGAASQRAIEQIVAAESAPAPASDAPLPATLAATGIGGANVRPYAPQYPLWTDGATKRRWIYLPAPIAVTPSGWELPVGTKLWKEFAFDGERVETRYMERTPRGWRFATYAWPIAGEGAGVAPRGETGDMRAPADAANAALVPPRGAMGAGGHRIPSESDCRACHSNGASPVLGYTALQLSADRDPNAPHAEPRPAGSLDLPALVASGLIAVDDVAPRIPARDADERAALGYLAANCGGCHRADGPLATLGMDFATDAAAGSRGFVAATPGSSSHGFVAAAPGSSSRGYVAATPGSSSHGFAAATPGSSSHGFVAATPGSSSHGFVAATTDAGSTPAALATTLGKPSHFTTAAARERVVAGEPARSVVVARMSSRVPAQQMPPIGTEHVDAAAVAVISRWISNLKGASS